MTLRYQVRDEWGSLVRCFPTLQEAQDHARLDKTFTVHIVPRTKFNRFQEALKRLGEALF